VELVTVHVLMSLLVPGNIGDDDEYNCTHMLIEVQQQLHFINSSLGRRRSLTQLIVNFLLSNTFKVRLIFWLPISPKNPA
jgi:hypothetical protein